MQKVDGENIINVNASPIEKAGFLYKILDSLGELHALESAPVDIFSVQECYFNKTINRIKTVRDMIPFADKEYIQINNRRCRNIFFYQSIVEERIRKLLFTAEFAIIHGDCTFSNILANREQEIIFIDPRGYFGFTEIYGDIYYDWAKLYYSVYGNYDQFNRHNFRLNINDMSIDLKIGSSNWESHQNCFFNCSFQIDEEKIKLIHALIWLSLTTYTWEDYDSICGAFYNGLYYLEEVL